MARKKPSPRRRRTRKLPVRLTGEQKFLAIEAFLDDLRGNRRVDPLPRPKTPVVFPPKHAMFERILPIKALIHQDNPRSDPDKGDK